MKKFSFYILMMTLPLISNAQNVWAPLGATWYYDFGNLAAQGYVKITSVKDTVISSKNCKALKKERYYYNWITSSFMGGVFDTTYTFLQNDTVFYYLNNQPYILYNFNAMPGDTLIVGEEQPNCNPKIYTKVKVDSTGTTTLNSTILKWVAVSPTPDAYKGFWGKIIERIGCVEFYMFPEYLNCVMDANEGGWFRCYFDSTFGHYQSGISPSCDYTVGTNEISSDIKVPLVFPNPTTGKITLDFPNFIGGMYHVAFYTSRGQLIQTFYTDQGKSIIDLSDFEDGLYNIVITDDQKNRNHIRVVKTGK